MLFAVLMMLTGISAQAQDVFKEIYDSSYKIASDPKEDVGMRKIASFKVDALTYINTKTLEQLTDTTREISKEEIAHIISRRDSLAYFLYDYVNLFAKEYQRAHKKKDKDAVLKAARETGRIVTAEEHSIYGGLGAIVAEITAQECPVRMKILGVPDENVIHASPRTVFHHYGFDYQGIYNACMDILK